MLIAVCGFSIPGGFMAVIKQGDKGKKVKELQEKLNKSKRAGKALKVDGIFGPKTLEGVKKFQKASYCKVDGLVGPKTMGALDSKPIKGELQTLFFQSGAFKQVGTKKTEIDKIINELSGDLDNLEGYCKDLMKYIASSRKDAVKMTKENQTTYNTILKEAGRVRKEIDFLLKVAAVNTPKAIEMGKELEKSEETAKAQYKKLSDRHDEVTKGKKSFQSSLDKVTDAIDKFING